MLRLLNRVMSSLPYHVTAAPRALAPLAAIGSDSLALVVTDYRLPDMNGRELIAALHTTRPEPNALVVTGQPPIDGDDHSWWAKQPHRIERFSSGCRLGAVVARIGPPGAAA